MNGAAAFRGALLILMGICVMVAIVFSPGWGIFIFIVSLGALAVAVLLAPLVLRAVGAAFQSAGGR